MVHGILQARILQWVAFPFSRGSFQPRDRTQVSHIDQLTHKGSPRILEWVTYPFSSDLPNPGIELGSPELQADSLPTVSYQGSPKAGNSGPVPEAEDLLEKENGYPLQYSCLENFMDRATRQAAVCGVAKSRA